MQLLQPGLRASVSEVPKQDSPSSCALELSWHSLATVSLPFPALFLEAVKALARAWAAGESMWGLAC